VTKNHKIEKSTDGTSRMSNSNYRPSDVLREGYKLHFSSNFRPITIGKIWPIKKMFTMGLSFSIFLCDWPEIKQTSLFNKYQVLLLKFKPSLRHCVKLPTRCTVLYIIFRSEEYMTIEVGVVQEGGIN